MAGRILVLDDEENYAEMLQDLLRENSYRVDMATRPERALAQLEEIPYDLVISDYKMPVMDGADFLKKSRELYPNLPFILVSGLMNTPELVKVANMGVTLVIEKPLDTEVFLREVARFSDPMTEEEQKELSQENQSASDAKAALSFPEEPRFFSAGNFMANRFLQRAWSISQSSSELFIMEPVGGDADLVIKDLSLWRGNDDKPVEMLRLSDSAGKVLGQLQTVLSDVEKSRLVGIRLDAISDIACARELTESIKEELEDPESVLLVYIVTTAAGPSEFAAFEEAASKLGATIPRICSRPSDLAVYARRIARIASEHVGRRQCGEFTSEAIYAMLHFEWPRNHKQLQEVIQAAVAASKDEPITLELLREKMGSSVSDPGAPESRLGKLMKTGQNRYLIEQMEQEGWTAAELAKKLQLDDSVQTQDDLKNMPLIRSELGNL